MTRGSCSDTITTAVSLPPTPIVWLDCSGTMALGIQKTLLGSGWQSRLSRYCSWNVQRHVHCLGGMPPLRHGTKGYSTPMTKGLSRRYNSFVPSTSESSAIDWPRYSIFVSNSTNPYFNLSLEDMCVAEPSLDQCRNASRS